MSALAGIAKALVGAAAAFVSSVALVASDGITSGEWWAAAAAGMAVLSAVYYTPNVGTKPDAPAAVGRHEAPQP